MTLLALVLSIFVAGLGALGIVAPGRLLAVVRSFESRAGLIAAAALRLVLGGSLFIAAPTSRAPQAVSILGVVTFVSGLVTPFIGLDRLRRLIDWWSARGPAFVRAWAGVALALGLFLVYALAP